MKKHCVYQIKNEMTGWVYIGQTCNNPVVRWKAHVSNLRDGTHPSVEMVNDFKLYGVGSFIFEVVGTFETQSEMMECERSLIKKYVNQGNIYNQFGNKTETKNKNRDIRAVLNPFFWLLALGRAKGK
jgi:hypothetical protein